MRLRLHLEGVKLNDTDVINEILTARYYLYE